MEKLDAAVEEAAGAAAGTAPPYYKCIKKNQSRTGFAMDSDKAAVIAPPMVIEVIEAKVNDTGVLRIHFSGGWVSERTASGIVCWEGLSEEDALALEDEMEAGKQQGDGGATVVVASAPLAAPASEPAPTPAPAPRKFKKGKVIIPDYTTPDLIRKSWMWMWRGKDWVKVFVTLDTYGNLCTFADDDAPQPAVLARPEEYEPEAPQGCADTGHALAFVVRGTAVGERLKSPTTIALVLEPVAAQPDVDFTPTESVAQEAQVWQAELERTFGDNSRAEAQLKKSPIWKKDSDREACAACKSGFSFFNRRHHCRGCGDLFCKNCSGIEVDCSHRGFLSPQRVCIICGGQKHALLIAQTQAGMAELLLANKNFEAAIAAADVGVKANSGYEEKTIVDPGEAERLQKAMAKNHEVLETARAAKVIQDEARQEVQAYFDSGEKALEAKDWDTAVECFEAGLAPDLRKAVNGEKNWHSCIKDMESALASVSEYREAEEAARAHASEALTRAEGFVVTQDWSDCVAACEAGLKDPAGVNDQTLIGKLEALLSLSVGNQHLEAGRSAMSENKNFETAIAEFETGLAQKTSEKGDDGGLTVALQAALREATAAKSAQDAARTDALQHCVTGEELLAGEIGSDTIDQAIASYEAGLALRDLTNGESGWDSCMDRLSTNIASATGLKRLQDEARAKAQSDFEAAKTRTIEAAELQDGIDSLSYAEQADKLGKAATALQEAVKALDSALNEQTNQVDTTEQLNALRKQTLIDLAHASAGEKAAAGADHMAIGAAATAEGCSAASVRAAERAKHHSRSANAFVCAIAAFNAGLVHDDDINDELSKKLESSRATAKLELARATARKEISEGDIKMEDGSTANSTAAGLEDPEERTSKYSEAMEHFRDAKKIYAGTREHVTESGEIDSAIDQAVGSAILELARATARRELSEGSCLLATDDYADAITKFETASTHSIDSEDLSAEIQAAIEAAREQARNVAQDKLAEGRKFAEAGQWADAIGVLELGLKNREVFAQPELVADLEKELARGKARKLHADAAASLTDDRYEDAISAVQAGLAENTDEVELTALLNTVLEEATTKKSAQDEARAEAQRLCDEGDRLLAGFDGRIRWADSIENSIVQYKLGLELADKVNGTHGWKSCIPTLRENLKHAEEELIKQEEARKTVGALLEDTHRLTPMTVAVFCTEVDSLEKLLAKIEAALQLETNDKDLTTQLRSALKVTQDIKAAEDAARKTATVAIAKADRLMGMPKKEYNTIDDAIASYEAALQQETHDEPQKAKVSQLLRVAQLAKTEQESARQACQAKYVEGSELFRSESWDDAITAFETGIKQPNVNDDALIGKLSKILRDTHVEKARAADIKSVNEQIGDVELIFLSGPPHSDAVWSKTKKTSIYGTYRGAAEIRALINEEVIDRRFPFFVKDGLCLYRDTRNEYWCIDDSGRNRTANGHFARIKMSGGTLPTESVAWEVREDAGERLGGGVHDRDFSSSVLAFRCLVAPFCLEQSPSLFAPNHSTNLDLIFLLIGNTMSARALTATFLRSEEEVTVWETWLPQAHAAQNQLAAFLGGKKGAIAVTCMPQGKEEDELPGSVTTRFDGEYVVSGELDGFPRHSLQPARRNERC